VYQLKAYVTLDISILFQTFDWLDRKFDEWCSKGGCKCSSKDRSMW